MELFTLQIPFENRCLIANYYYTTEISPSIHFIFGQPIVPFSVQADYILMGLTFASKLVAIE